MSKGKSGQTEDYEYFASQNYSTVNVCPRPEAMVGKCVRSKSGWGSDRSQEFGAEVPTTKRSLNMLLQGECRYMCHH